MNKEDIINAWATIREENNTIPDDVLDFMKDSALKILSARDFEPANTITEKLANDYTNDKQDPVWRDIKFDSLRAITAFVNYKL